MKRTIWIVVAILLLVGCSRRGAEHGRSGWPRELDYCRQELEELDMSFFLNESVDSSVWRMNRLLTRMTGDTSATARAVQLFFDARLARACNRDEESLGKMSRLKASLDSAKSPYLYNRAKREMLLSKREFGPAEYKQFQELRDYFAKTRDSVMLATTYHDIAASLQNIGMLEEAWTAQHKSRELFEALGMPDFVQRSLIAEETLYRADGKPEAADSVRRILVADSSIARTSPMLREVIVRNSWLGTGELPYLEEGLRICLSDTNFRPILPLYYGFKAAYHLDHGRPDSALVYVNEAERLGNESLAKPHHWLVIYDVKCAALDSLGDAAGALEYMKRTRNAEREYQATHQTEQVRNAEAQRQIMLLREEQQRRSARERVVWAVVLAAVVVLAGVWLVFLWRGRKRAEVKSLNAELDNERAQKHLAATVLAMAEKDQLLKEMNKNIGEMNRDGQIQDKAARELSTMMRLHLQGTEEWAAFGAMLDKVRPGFRAALKARSPLMTEKYVRLASYILVGMTNKQIARLLMIRPESVHQARWRLRKMLGLETADSLEDCLNNL